MSPNTLNQLRERFAPPWPLDGNRGTATRPTRQAHAGDTTSGMTTLDQPTAPIYRADTILCPLFTLYLPTPVILSRPCDFAYAPEALPDETHRPPSPTD